VSAAGTVVDGIKEDVGVASVVIWGSSVGRDDGMSEKTWRPFFFDRPH
jgi:hypothetical protein